MRNKGPGHLLIEQKEIFDLLLDHLSKRRISILAVLHKQGAIGCCIRNIGVGEWDDNSRSVQQYEGRSTIFAPCPLSLYAPERGNLERRCQTNNVSTMLYIMKQAN